MEDGKRQHPPMLFEVKKRFDEWRKQNGKTKSIPKDLLQATTELLSNYSPHHISKVLKINLHELEKRVSAENKVKNAETSKMPNFLELKFPKVVSPTHFTLEIERPDGTRIKFNITGESALDIASEFLRSYHGGTK